MAVSPFDGANRIRFKGSWAIADFRVSIADLKSGCSNRQFGDRQLAMSQLSVLRQNSPESVGESLLHRLTIHELRRTHTKWAETKPREREVGVTRR